jgi:hypothetical protein
MLEGLTTEDFRREPLSKKWGFLDEVNAYVRKVHYDDFMQRNPWAYPNDVLMDWAIIVGIDKIVPADEFARRMADTPLLVTIPASAADRPANQDE